VRAVFCVCYRGGGGGETSGDRFILCLKN
jgi:hypothetical protein